MFTVDDPWGEAPQKKDSTWAHASLCWATAIILSLYSALDLFVNGFRLGILFWAAVATFYFWRAVVYTSQKSLIED